MCSCVSLYRLTSYLSSRKVSHMLHSFRLNTRHSKFGWVVWCILPLHKLRQERLLSWPVYNTEFVFLRQPWMKTWIMCPGEERKQFCSNRGPSWMKKVWTGSDTTGSHLYLHKAVSLTSVFPTISASFKRKKMIKIILERNAPLWMWAYQTAYWVIFQATFRIHTGEHSPALRNSYSYIFIF